MRIPGRLRDTTLGDVLGTLARGKATGVLRLFEEPLGRLHEVYLVEGSVQRVGELSRRDDGLRLVSLMRKRGWLRPGDAARLEELVARGARSPAGELAVREAGVPRYAVEAAARAQLEARLEALFEIRDARLSFHAARPLPPHERKTRPLAAGEFLPGRPRARERRAGAEAERRNVPLETPRSELRRVLRRLALALHPDRLGHLPEDERARRAALFSRLTSRLAERTFPDAYAGA